MTASVGVVVLSQGTRPADLTRALGSALRQQGVQVDCVVVGNGWQPVGLPSGVRSVALTDNVGIPAGRNVGAAAVAGELLLFLDDDAELLDPQFLARAAAQFAADASLAILQPRVTDPLGRPLNRRFVPRLRVGDPERSSDTAVFWEGCCVIRRSALAGVGGWVDAYFYAHEGIELAWRLIDAGYRVRYQGDLVVSHPSVAPTRHAEFYFLNARNRVWLARRNLPAPVAVAYVAVWLTLTVLRTRDPAGRRQALRGFAAGARGPCGPRRPVSWRAVWRMARIGRPPVI